MNRFKINGTPTLADPQAIVEAYRLLVGEEKVTELQAVEATADGDQCPRTLSGYFNSSDALARAVGRIKTAKGIYIIPNAVDPALLSRAENRLRASAEGDGTRDRDILRRRWLLIGCDAVRPAGISSTDAEHAAALQRAQDIAAHLRKARWPDPIIADSGNGAHLLYRIELAGEDGGIVQRCLQSLAARFDDAAVKVDTSVHNAARIWKLYGTMGCKGPNVPDRPWRMSRIIKAPNVPRPVPIDLLGALASAMPAPAAQGPAANCARGEAFDVAGFIRQHGLEADGPTDWDGKQGPGRRWTLRRSPLCEHHGDGPYIFQDASGEVSAGCRYNCNWTWDDLRTRLERRGDQPGGVLRNVRTPSAAPGNSQAWPELERLDGAVPSFPVFALPAPLREWVAAESHATQTPADLAGLLALAVCSSCAAKHVEIEPHPGWREPVNLFVAILLAPGNRKSAVFQDATQPLREVERRLIDANRAAVAREQSEYRQTQKRLERCEKKAAEGDAKAAAEAQSLAECLDSWRKPVLPQLIVDNVTGEKLEILLEEQGGRLASLSAEGGVFDVMAGRYTKGGTTDFDVYLKGHAGDELRTDRVSRKGVYLEKPALTCGYAIQPQVIAGIAGDPAFRGRGLLARFLYAKPGSWIGSRQVDPKPVPVKTAEAYATLVRELAESPPKGILTLRPDAAVLFDAWQAEVEAMLGDGGQLEAIRDWGGKLVGTTARLAAVLHCVKYRCTATDHEVEPATIEAAVKIGRYLTPHAEAVLTMMEAHQDTPDDDARYVLRWITAKSLKEFTKRDAQQHGKRRFPKAEDIDPALKKLTQCGYIRARPQAAKGSGRPPSPVYEVNPAVFERKAGEACSQSSEFASPGGSEDCENTPLPLQTQDRVLPDDRFEVHAADGQPRPWPHGPPPSAEATVAVAAADSTADDWGEV